MIAQRILQYKNCKTLKTILFEIRLHPKIIYTFKLENFKRESKIFVQNYV